MPDDITVATIEAFIKTLEQGRDKAVGQLRDHISLHMAEVTKHTAEIEAARALVNRLVGKAESKIEDEVVAAATFVLTKPQATRQIIRWILIGGAGLVAVWAVLHGAF